MHAGFAQIWTPHIFGDSDSRPTRAVEKCSMLIHSGFLVVSFLLKMRKNQHFQQQRDSISRAETFAKVKYTCENDP